MDSSTVRLRTGGNSVDKDGLVSATATVRPKSPLLCHSPFMHWVSLPPTGLVSSKHARHSPYCTFQYCPRKTQTDHLGTPHRQQLRPHARHCSRHRCTRHASLYLGPTPYTWV